MTIEQRLNRLETQNRRLKFGGLFLLLGFAAAFLMGQAKSVPEEIRAKKFVVVDDHGVARVEVGPSGTGSSGETPVFGLFIFDKKYELLTMLQGGTHEIATSLVFAKSGRGRTVLGESALVFLDENNKPRVQLLYDESGSKLNLLHENDEFNVQLAVARAKGGGLSIGESVGLTVSDRGASLQLSHQKSSAWVTAWPQGPQIFLTDDEGPQNRVVLGMDSLVLFNADGEVVHQVR